MFLLNIVWAVSLFKAYYRIWNFYAAYAKQRDLVVVGSEKNAKIDYFKSQELEVFDIQQNRTSTVRPPSVSRTKASTRYQFPMQNH